MSRQRKTKTPRHTTRSAGPTVDERRLLSSVARFHAGPDDARHRRLPAMETMRRHLGRIRKQVVDLELALADPFAPGAAKVLEKCDGAWSNRSYGAKTPGIDDFFAHIWSIGDALLGGCMDEKALRKSRRAARKQQDAAERDHPNRVLTASVPLGESSTPQSMSRMAAPPTAVAALRHYPKTRRPL